MTMIILTNVQSNQVRCLTILGAALAPKPISVGATASIAGKYALPVAVLSDPSHQRFWSILQPLPQVPNTSIADADWSKNATDLMNNTYDQSWIVAQVRSVPPSIG